MPGHMMQVHASKSAMHNAIVQLLAHPLLTHDLRIAAAEFVIAEARFNDWFLRVAKKKSSFTDDEVLAMLETIEVAEAEVVGAWDEFRAGDWTDWANDTPFWRAREGQDVLARVLAPLQAVTALLERLQLPTA